MGYLVEASRGFSGLKYFLKEPPREFLRFMIIGAGKFYTYRVTESFTLTIF